MRLFAAIVLAVLFASCSKRDASNVVASPHNSGVEMWLVDYDALIELLDEEEVRLQEFPLRDFPLETRVVRDEDVLKWNWSEQSVLLSAAAVDRLPRRGEPRLLTSFFVLKLNGTPLYFGAITTGRSSDSRAFPSILVDRFPDRPVEAPHRIKIDKCFPPRLLDISPENDTRLKPELHEYLRESSRLEIGE